MNLQQSDLNSLCMFLKRHTEIGDDVYWSPLQNINVILFFIIFIHVSCAVQLIGTVDYIFGTILMLSMYYLEQTLPGKH